MKRKSLLTVCAILLIFAVFVACRNFAPSDGFGESGTSEQITASVEVTAPTTQETETSVNTTTRATEKDETSLTSERTTAAESTSQTAKPQTGDKIKLTVEKMTLEEKIGQLFIIRPDSLDLTKTPEEINDPSGKGVTKLSEKMKKALQKYHVGGVVIFSKNIVDEAQLTEFIEDMQNASATGLFVSVDEEGGKVARLANHSAFDLPKFDSAATVGESGKTSDAFSMGKTIGKYLAKYGFNMDFAPVADVNTNPENPIIGERAFSPNPKIATKMSDAMASALKEQGIIPVFKHFPGHGDTAEDSHKGIAVSNKTESEMMKCEWLPYESLDDDCCVMVGHIAAPKITGDLTPASMSYEIVSGVLKKKLGFKGLIITDSLSMGAVTDEYTPSESAVDAVKAGCDILLCPYDLDKAYDGLISAVGKGELSEERIDESVYKILKFKMNAGLEIG